MFGFRHMTSLPIAVNINYGLLMEIQNASYASNKYTRTASTVTPVLIPKESVRCAVGKC
uniref:Uncharacterized protein n=1 Tax=Fagus sylvatica TaxID=28930 RepID=A0A2N9IPK0_FAGSY